jgi:streptogramin lyase
VGPRMGLRGVDLRGRRFDLGADHEGPFAFVVIATGTDADTVWVGRSFFAQDDTTVILRLERADTRAGRATTIPARMNLEGSVTAMAAGEEALWIACCGYDSGQSRILRLDPATLERRASIRMPRRVCEMRVGDGWLWAIDDRGIVARIDPQTNQVIATIETPVGSVPNGWLGPCNALAHAPGVIWAGGGSGTVARIDARTATLTWSSVLSINERPVEVHRLAADADSLWMTSRGGELYRLTSGGRLAGAARINGARAVTIGGGAIWVGDDHGAVRRIDPAGVPPLPDG